MPTPRGSAGTPRGKGKGGTPRKLTVTSSRPTVERLEDRLNAYQVGSESHASSVGSPLAPKPRTNVGGVQLKGAVDDATVQSVYFTEKEQAELSRAFFAHTKHITRPVAAKNLILRWMRGIGPMRHMETWKPDEGFLELALQNSTCRVAQKGEELISHGQVNDAIYILISGTATLKLPKAFIHPCANHSLTSQFGFQLTSERSSSAADAAPKAALSTLLIKVLGAFDLPGTAPPAYPLLASTLACSGPCSARSRRLRRLTRRTARAQATPRWWRARRRRARARSRR